MLSCVRREIRSWSTRVAFFEYSYSKPSVLGKYSYSLGCVLGTPLKKQWSTTSTLPNGKASCTSALKCQSNFVLPRVMSNYVTTSVRSLVIVQVQAFDFLRCRTSANCYWSRRVTHFQMCVHVERFRNILKHST